jgi:uncharacterized protein YigE (DUF2233 family)
MTLRQSSSFALFVFLIALPSIGASQTRPNGTRLKSSPGLAVTDLGGWKTVQKGVEFRKLAIQREDPHQLIDLKLVRFDTRLIAPRILRSAQYNVKSVNVKTLAEKSGAIAAINANYFDENGKPLGFLKAASSEVTPQISPAALYTGVFAVKDHLPVIVHRDRFTPEQADEALQAGPLLLMKGDSLAVSLGAGRQRRRALIGIDREQRLIIAVTDSLFGGLSWVELQELFGAAQWRLQARDLLNLDGGGSAQLYLRAGQFEEYVTGATEVPVVIGFFPRTN